MPPPGNFVDTDGVVLGRHKGIVHYTVGQRRGLQLSMGKRIFVSRICPETNEVVIGDNEDLMKQTVQTDAFHFMSVEDIKEDTPVIAKIRYNHKGDKAVLHKREDGRIECIFDQPQRAVTPGQALVCYQGEYVLGGGVII